MNKYTLIGYLWVLILCESAYTQAQTLDTLFKSSVSEVMNNVKKGESMKDLLNVEVTTASNTAERISDAPASTLVITREQIQQRGYVSLLDMLQDLPAMDMAISYGDTPFKAYWRGYRSTIGDSYLFMVDGIICNDLYFNQASSLAVVPLSHIEQVEIVYGPASAVYGANAFMGVVNVITRKDYGGKYHHFSGNVSSNPNGYNWTDLSFFYQQDRIRFSLAARYENGNANQRINPNDFYWLQEKFYADPRLWGDFVNNPNIAGTFSSPVKNKGLDARLYIHKLEIGGQFFESNSGYGTVYPADRIQTSSRWILPEWSIFGRYKTQIGTKLNSQTLIRYRGTGVDENSQDLEGYNVTNTSNQTRIVGGTPLAPAASARMVNYTYWHTQNRSVSLFQDFDWQITTKLTAKIGFKFEDKDLQRAYELNSNGEFFPDSLKRASLAYPSVGLPKPRPENRINWQDKGFYSQFKYALNDSHIFNGGVRMDNNSSYGTAITLRAGYIWKWKNLIAKVFYGEAFQEPVPRLLYGGWRGSGSDPSLKPERSRTVEFNLNYTTEKTSQHLNMYWVNNYDGIISFAGGAANIGRRRVLGFDYQLQAFIPLFKKTEIWAYYSAIFFQDEQKFNAQKQETGTGIIGDLAPHKIFLGINSQITSQLNLNLKTRFMSERPTVSTNPLGKVDPYFLLDLNLMYQDLFVKGLGLRVTVNNVFDTVYYHSGLRSADSGNSGGTWDGKRWNGSSGWYNSLLVQPRRFAYLSLILAL